MNLNQFPEQVYLRGNLLWWSGPKSGYNPVLTSLSGAGNTDLDLRAWIQQQMITGGIQGVRATIVSIDTDTVLQELKEDVTYLVDCTSGMVEITLPPVINTYYKVTMKKIDASGNLMRVTAPVGSLVDGLQSQDIDSQYTSVTVVTDLQNYYVI
jgi:hypothetical protein